MSGIASADTGEVAVQTEGDAETRKQHGIELYIDGGAECVYRPLAPTTRLVGFFCRSSIFGLKARLIIVTIGLRWRNISNFSVTFFTFGASERFVIVDFCAMLMSFDSIGKSAV